MHIWISVYILHDGAERKVGTFLSGEAILVQRELFWAGKIGSLGKANGLQTPPREQSPNHRIFFKMELLKMMLERGVYFLTCRLSQASLCSFSPLLNFLQFPEDTLLLSNSQKPASCIACISPVSWRQNCEPIKFLSFIFPVPLLFAD